MPTWILLAAQHLGLFSTQGVIISRCPAWILIEGTGVTYTYILNPGSMYYFHNDVEESVVQLGFILLFLIFIFPRGSNIEVS